MTDPLPHALPLSSVPDEPVEVEVVDTPADDDEWHHQTITFMGDELQVRKPTQQALAAFSLATSKYVSAQVRNDMTGMFINRHLSTDSYDRVFSRLMDPDDEDYTIDTIGQLMGAIVTQHSSATT